MREFRHLTPRYVKNRFKIMAEQVVGSRDPWLTRDAIRFLQSWLCASDRGLELGSGRSTLWFCERVGHLISVEEKSSWYERVSSTAAASGVSGRLDYRFCPTAELYLDVFSDIETASLDFCLVDGAYREQCILPALRVVRPGGIIIVDDAQRYLPAAIPTFSPNARGETQGCESATWEAFLTQLRAGRVYWTTNGVQDTAIYFPGSQGR